jgi:hypothetical protein
MECTAHIHVLSVDNLNKCMKLPHSLHYFSSTEFLLKQFTKCMHRYIVPLRLSKCFTSKITIRILIIFVIGGLICKIVGRIYFQIYWILKQLLKIQLNQIDLF